MGDLPDFTRAAPWEDRAQCHGQALVMFGADADAARAVCDGCPVVEQCLRTALDMEVRDGVWGGLDFHERTTRCPICLGPKEPTALACTLAHVLIRTARLVEIAAADGPDVELTPRIKPSGRTNPTCPLPRGANHSSRHAYKMGCRCTPSREAIRRERLARGTHQVERGSYRVGAC